VARAVDVGVVSVIRLVLDVCSRDGDTSLSLFGSLVDGTILEELGVALFGLSLGDGSGQSSLGNVRHKHQYRRRQIYLSVIDVADGTCNGVNA